jgi:16S rRNA (uracil1498-N3)-methyltransferase
MCVERPRAATVHSGFARIDLTVDTYYAAPDRLTGEEILLDGTEAAHLTRVMRHGVGDQVRLVDGAGMAFDATIVAVAGTTVRCRITARHPRLSEPAVSVVLGAALLKHAAAFDYLVEKATELGVSAIVPVRTARTIPGQAKVDRWRKIALASMKQCGRSVLPEVTDPVSFTEFLRRDPGESALRTIAHEAVDEPLLPRLLAERRPSRLIVAIGPEGGFAESEVDAARAGGFLAVSLGTRRLRAETAAALAVASPWMVSPSA